MTTSRPSGAITRQIEIGGIEHDFAAQLAAILREVLRFLEIDADDFRLERLLAHAGHRLPDRPPGRLERDRDLVLQHGAGRLRGQLAALPGPVLRPAQPQAAQVAALATAKGWAIAKSDPASGHVEATASVSFIRFHDDVVLRITPTADGKGSRVDMRSVSRIGISDFGVNAKRIRAFLKSLAAT